jgi:hypothetical protein
MNGLELHPNDLAVASDGEDAAGELSNRCNAYNVLSRIWGTQTESHLAAAFVRGAQTAVGTDECLVSIRRGLRRLRPNVSPIVYGARHHSSTTPMHVRSQVPLDPIAAAKFNAPLLLDYCSKPLPKLRTVSGAAGWAYTELSSEGIGRQREVDLGFGAAANDVPFSIDTYGSRLVRNSTTFRTSTAFFEKNFLVHRPSFGEVVPELIAFQSTPGDESPAIARAAAQLPLREKVIALGPASSSVASEQWPGLHDTLRYACDALNWDLAEFDLFRLQVRYPVLGSVIRIQFYLDEK